MSVGQKLGGVKLWFWLRAPNAVAVRQLLKLKQWGVPAAGGSSGIILSSLVLGSLHVISPDWTGSGFLSIMISGQLNNLYGSSGLKLLWFIIFH